MNTIFNLSIHIKRLYPRFFHTIIKYILKYFFLKTLHNILYNFIIKISNCVENAQKCTNNIYKILGKDPRPPGYDQMVTFDC